MVMPARARAGQVELHAQAVGLGGDGAFVGGQLKLGWKRAIDGQLQGRARGIGQRALEHFHGRRCDGDARRGTVRCRRPQHAAQLAAGYHLQHDVAAADQFAVDGSCGMVGQSP